LFALVLVLGMIVDDAIVVIENFHRYMEMGYSRKDAAVKGTEEIMWPVIAAVLTTIASFMPIMFMQGRMGQFMRVFPIVVVFALMASLFESLIILPSHLADLGEKELKKKEHNKLQKYLVKHYRSSVVKVLSHRFLTIFIVLVLLVLSGMALAFRLIKFEFFPRRNSDTLVLKLSTPVGTSLEQTELVTARIEDFVFSMEESSDVEAVLTQIGLIRGRGTRSTSSNNAEIKLDMLDTEKRSFDDDVIKRKLRDFMKNLPGLYSFSFDQERRGPPTGNDVEMRIFGDSLERLDYIGNYVKAQLAQIPGLSDIEDSFEPGKQEIQIVPMQDRLSYYGLTTANIASTVRNASNGVTISKYRGDGLDEYDVVLKVKEDQIDDLKELKNLMLKTAQGKLVPLKDIAEFRIESGLAQIQHRDSDRYITITAATGTYVDANGNRAKRTTDEVMKMLEGDKIRKTSGIFSDFAHKFPGYYIEYGGVQEMMKESYNSLYLAFLIAILGVYTILAAQFKSYIQPLIVMMTIPFAFIGVVLGLLLTGLPFSLNTLIAVVALAGVVVNDSLVMVDFVNRERENGIDRWNSLINAGALRLRPIILTTVTTVGGMMPMIFSQSESSADYKSMAVSIVFGLSFATLLTLYVIPTVYSFVDSVAGRLHASRFTEHIKFKDAIINGSNDPLDGSHPE
jgi:multidrug efflux pump subunit AcrB